MTYNITKTDGTIIKELAENIIDYDTLSNIGLIGKLSPNYGEIQSNNFVHLAEHFANTSAPENPIVGMIYYNTSTGSVYVCTNENQKSWSKLASMNMVADDSNNDSANSTESQNGDIRYNQTEKKLYIFDSSIQPYGDWVLIGPENYLNKTSYNTTISTGINMSENSYEIEFGSDTSNLVSINIIASEKQSSSSANYGIKEPSCMAWKYKMLVNSYYTNTGDVVKTVGEPSYEIIAKNDGTDDWYVKPSIKDNRLNILVWGNSKDVLSTINWYINVEILKV